MALAAVTARSAAAPRDVAAAMARDGAVRVSGLFPLPLLRRIRRETFRRHEAGELRREGLVRDVAGRYAAVLPFSGPFLDPRFYAAPRLHAMLAALLGDDYCIGSLEAVVAEPGALAQHQHIDGPLRLERRVGRSRRPYARDLSDLPPYAVTLAVPLQDVTEENGPTAVWRGSHKAALRPKPPGAREVARRWPVESLTGPLGFTYFFDYRVFHGGMPNHSREPRIVLMFVFTRSWFRDPNQNEVHPSVVIAPKDLARVGPKSRPLFMLAPAARRRLWPSRSRP